MTIGIRDTRKIIGRYCLTEQDVRGQARFDDSIGIFPEIIDGYGVLVLPTTIAAAVSLKKGVSTAEVHIEDIQRELRRQGVRLV
jgi:hypothetical protein